MAAEPTPIANGVDFFMTKAEKKRLAGAQLSNAFDQYDRMFTDYGSGDVFDYGEFNVRDMDEMLRRDGNAKKIEQVLTLPIRGADFAISGNGPAVDFVRENLTPILTRLIDQAVAACIYRRTFFEKVWALDGSMIYYDSIQWRPPGSCEAAFDSKTATPTGFRQRVAHPGAVILTAEGKDAWPGYVRIPRQKAYVYTHGAHRQPVTGISDLDVALWAYETRNKLLFLWFQFLENHAHPKIVAWADDTGQADENAGAIAELRAGGVLGLVRPGDPQAKGIDIIESAGAGANGFQAAITYLESMQTNSVLAGFTDLSGAAVNQGIGSKALSADQSEFFLGARQAVADEIAYSITLDIIRPLVVYNFGPDVEVPKLEIGPIGSKQTDRALELLQSIIQAPTLNVPGEFVDMLMFKTSAFMGLDVLALQKIVTPWREKQNRMSEQMDALREKAAQAGQTTEGPDPEDKSPAAQDLSKKIAAANKIAALELSRATNISSQLVQRAYAGEDPEKVLAEIGSGRA